MGRDIYVVNEDFDVVKRKLKWEKGKVGKDDLIALDYMNIGWYIIIPILFFLGIGLLVRKYVVKTDIVVIMFVFVGVVSSFYNVFKLIGWKR